MKTFLQLCVLMLVGTLAGLAHGAFRGFPRVEPATVCAAPVATAMAVEWISIENAHDLLQKKSVTFVDARSQQKFTDGHILGAIHKDQLITFELEDPTATDPSQTIVVYDDTSDECALSRGIAKALNARGLDNVRVLQGGFEAWGNAHYPAASGH